MKTFRCGDIIPGCEASFRALDDQELMAMVRAHASDEHSIDPVPEPVQTAVLAPTVELA